MSTPRHDPAPQAGSARAPAGAVNAQAPFTAATPAQVFSATDWLALLDAVAAGDVHLVLSADGGARVVLLAEQELLDLQQAAAAAQAARVVLTSREREALMAVEDGLAVSQVAERLGIARGTAVQHLAAARRKFGVGTSAQAVARARQGGQLG